jgi:putative RecB family exonuclease
VTTKQKLPRLSPSRINTYLSCPMKYYFQYEVGVPTIPSEAMLRGTFVHSVLERLMARKPAERTNDASREDFAAAQATMMQDEEFRMLALSDAEREQFWESARECLRAYYRIEHPRDANVVALEKWVTAPLGEFELTGYIDRLERDARGLVVVDYKAAKPKKAEWSTDYLRQLTLYALMCEVQMNETPHQVRIFYLGGGKDEHTRDDRVVTQEVTSATIDAVRDDARRVFSGLGTARATDGFATNVTKLCDWCDYRQWCPAHGGDKASAKAETTATVALRRREVGLPDSA